MVGWADCGCNAFQSYLSPCLTMLEEELKDAVLFFQSYLSPCLTIEEAKRKVVLAYYFQSYLSPCLTLSIP